MGRSKSKSYFKPTEVPLGKDPLETIENARLTTNQLGRDVLFLRKVVFFSLGFLIGEFLWRVFA